MRDAVDQSVAVSAGDVIAEAGCLDPAAHLGELGDEAREGFDFGEYSVRGGWIERPEVVVLRREARERPCRPEEVSHAGRKGRPPRPGRPHGRVRGQSTRDARVRSA